MKVRRLATHLLALAVFLSACAAPGSAAPVVKIGLIAPFEGLGRPLGYAVLPGVKAAIADLNAAGDLGPYRVALVALNDDLDPQAAAAQARVLAQDPDILAVLGPFDSVVAAAAAPVLAEAGVPTLLAAPLQAPPASIRSLCPAPAQINAALESENSKFRVAITLSSITSAFSAANELSNRYGEGWRGVLLGGPDLARPWFVDLAGAAAEGTRAAMCDLATLAPGAGQGEDAALAQEAALAGAGARFLLAALAQDIRQHGRPTRTGVATALAAQPIDPGLAWFQVVNGQWVRSPRE